MSERFEIRDDVADALAARRGVVALESTVVTHGLPAPEGVEAATECESEVAATGALPATIGVLDGRIRVGLTRDELTRLAGAPGGAKAVKLNLGNLAAQLIAGGAGSTTVAATTFAAARAGIEVFATGGIGGVHRGAAESFDVSTDLAALARHPVAVVCAGAKAILDLPKTVEALETLGVPVLGYRTDQFPAFYRRESGLRVDHRFDAIADLARAVRAHFDLGMGSGVVIANPVPAEHEMARELYESSIAQALDEARREAVRGRAVTPFLLERLRQLTGSASVLANRALLRHNARVAGELSVALAGLRRPRPIPD
jgi:pseudouridine-5'-phosphate glycosidase